MIEYPKVLYKDGQAQRVAHAEAEAALGKGWSENPGGDAEKPGTGIYALPPAAVKTAAYEPKEYPKVLYRKVDGKIASRRVADADAEAALGEGWSEDTAGEPIPAPAALTVGLSDEMLLEEMRKAPKARKATAKKA